MSGLADHAWKGRFSSSIESLLEGFYRPALMDAIRYWRITGYFTAAPCFRFWTWWRPQPMGSGMDRCA